MSSCGDCQLDNPEASIASIECRTIKKILQIIVQSMLCDIVNEERKLSKLNTSFFTYFFNIYRIIDIDVRNQKVIVLIAH